MSQAPTLEQLRREIDRIDDAIHDLVMERAKVVERVGATKGRDAVHLRPAREAHVMRRLLARHEGAFPRAALIGLWREMMTVFTQMQGPFAVATPQDLLRVARDQYGSMTPLVPVADGAAALRALEDGRVDVAVAPWPRDGERGPWWLHLFAPDAPFVVACLPCFGEGGETPAAVTLAHAPLEPTGDDMALIGVEGDPPGAQAVANALAAAGFAVSALHMAGDGRAACAEIDGFVDPADGRLRSLDALLPGAQARLFGSLAKPLAIAEPAPTPAPAAATP